MEVNQILNLIDATVNPPNRETPPIRHYPSENYESIFPLGNHVGNRTEPVVPPRSQRHCCQPIRFQRLYCYGCFTILKFVSYCPHLLRHDDFLSETICYDCKFNSSWTLATDDQSYLEE